MTYQITFDKAKGYFSIATDGDFDVHDFKFLIQELLSHPDWKPGTNCLFDYRKTDFLKTPTATLFIPSDLHEEKNALVGNGKSALLMKNQGNYGMGRMYQMNTEDRVDTTFGIFTDLDEAVAWLQSQEESGKPDAPAKLS